MNTSPRPPIDIESLKLRREHHPGCHLPASVCHYECAREVSDEEELQEAYDHASTKDD